MLEVEAAERGARAKDSIEDLIIDVANRRRNHSTEDALTVSEIAPGSSYEIVRERLNGRGRPITVGQLDVRLFLRRHSIDHTERPCSDLAGYFRCGGNCRLAWDVAVEDVIRRRKTLRRAADSARIEVTLRAVV